MRDRWAAFVSMAAVLFSCAWARAEVTLEVGTAIGAAGRPAFIQITLRAADERVAGTQNELSFDRLTPVAVRHAAALRPDCALDPSLAHQPYSPFAFRPAGCSPGEDCDVVALVLSLSTDPIPDGTPLYTCRVDIDPAAQVGSYPVRCANPAASDPQGVSLPTTCTDGAVQVVADLATPTATPTRPPTLSPTPTETGTPCDPACAAVRVGTANGRAGERVPLAVHLDARGQGITGVQADLGFDRHAAVAAGASGQPDCHVNTAIGATSIVRFSFQPPRCAGSNCGGVRALVLYAEDIAIPDGAELFTCAVDVADDAPAGSYEVAVANVLGTTAGGMPVVMTGHAGAVIVAADSSSRGGGGCQIAAPHTPATWPLAAALVLVCLAVGRRSPSGPH